MNELQIFKSEEFGSIRTVIIDDEPWFVGKDVALALGYERATKAIQDHVDFDDKDEVPIRDSIGRMQKTPIISESGLYALIFGSKLKSAKQFKHWVTSEVLPSIRKTGSYRKPQTAMEMLQLTQQAVLEVDEKIKAVDKDLQDFKQDMPILGIEESRITAAVRRKGAYCLGGKESEAYKDKSLRGKVYSDIYSQLKREFGVDTYKAIKRSMCNKAVSIVESYELPLVLLEAIENSNAQMDFLQ